jgi:hypothetical protein
MTAAMARFAGTSHHVSNIEVSFDGPDRAVSVTYLIAWHRSPDPAVADFTMYGRYYDTFVRTSEGWRIAARRLRSAGTATIPASELAQERFESIGRRPVH